ncbi:uncharacterized protein LOC112348760 [Selaginella moellendorffii]|uniref:uncharacterized protein LOC112348760 n=1 Tax=Selaginella moellendorffii TaxID=88036 RepID=UPI000D1CC136|nr:uncharacterized protein LOC112348760 [Selaginella moellendorffii]|eukprot:XP_024537696.1 uncharacterized protein LOC112348760 [Selaginella moellendorffii]
MVAARAMAAGLPVCSSSAFSLGTNAATGTAISSQLFRLTKISCHRFPAIRPLHSWISSRPPKRKEEKLGGIFCSAAHAGGDPSSSSKTRATRPPKDPQSIRERALAFVDNQAGFLWLLGPVLATSAVVLPTLSLSLVDLLQANFWIGLGAVFALDLIYVLAADAFFVFADKCGHQQSVPGELPPWIAPWEILGYPKGLPQVWDYTTYAGIGVAAFALVMSIFSGKPGVALAAFGPYLALILVQAAYERLLCKERLPTYPLVAAVYTMYRFRQLGRAMELLGAFGAGPVLVGSVRVLMAIWTFYLATFLSQLPWLYCTWNANKIS